MVPGTVLGWSKMGMNKTDNPFPCGAYVLMEAGGRQTINVIYM